MSAGFQLLRAILDNGSQEAFRRLSRELFADEERPTFDFLVDFTTRHGVLPPLSALRENGLNLPTIEGPVSYYLDRVHQRAIYWAWQANERQLQDTLRSANVGNIRPILEGMLAQMRSGEVNRDTFTIYEAIAGAWQDYVDARAAQGLRGVTYGWDELD